MALVVLDYGMGNIHSVNRKMHLLNKDVRVAASPEDLRSADKIILPGVGHFGKAMENLSKLNLLEELSEQVLVKKKPILGICLGMQLMARQSEEGDEKGLGWFDARVIKFRISDTLKHKVPHTGWNQIDIKKDSLLMRNLKSGDEVYFVHSYHFSTENAADVLNTTFYEYEFVSAVERENIFGVQYHPEKSHQAGLQILKNFMEL
ncbi:MAG: imidazole glycerol phosphate synthase subunit HisH [Chitinophagales bacterium]